jgi:threonine/homoserine/homoserine lactone efflux protein
MTDLAPYFPPASGAFLITSILIELTPGPNMGYLAIVALTQGKRAGFSAVAGMFFGLAIIGIGAAFGIAALIQASPAIYNGLRYAGILFLLYLAWAGWRGEAKEEDGTHGLTAQFLRGLTSNILNPKAAVFYVAVLPEFVSPARPVLAQTIILTITYVLVATGIHGSIVLAAGSLRPWLSGGEKEVFVRRSLSVALACFAIWFAINTAR